MFSKEKHINYKDYIIGRKRKCRLGCVATAVNEEGKADIAKHGNADSHAIIDDYLNGVITHKGQKLTLKKLYPASKYHICKYCSGIAIGEDENLLCEACCKLHDGIKRFDKL